MSSGETDAFKVLEKCISQGDLKEALALCQVHLISVQETTSNPIIRRQWLRMEWKLLIHVNGALPGISHPYNAVLSDYITSLPDLIQSRQQALITLEKNMDAFLNWNDLDPDTFRHPLIPPLPLFDFEAIYHWTQIEYNACKYTHIVERVLPVMKTHFLVEAPDRRVVFSLIMHVWQCSLRAHRRAVAATLLDTFDDVLMTPWRDYLTGRFPRPKEGSDLELNMTTLSWRIPSEYKDDRELFFQVMRLQTRFAFLVPDGPLSFRSPQRYPSVKEWFSTTQSWTQNRVEYLESQYQELTTCLSLWDSISTRLRQDTEGFRNLQGHINSLHLEMSTKRIQLIHRSTEFLNMHGQSQSQQGVDFSAIQKFIEDEQDTIGSIQETINALTKQHTPQGHTSLFSDAQLALVNLSLGANTLAFVGYKRVLQQLRDLVGSSALPSRAVSPSLKASDRQILFHAILGVSVASAMLSSEGILLAAEQWKYWYGDLYTWLHSELETLFASHTPPGKDDRERSFLSRILKESKQRWDIQLVFRCLETILLELHYKDKHEERTDHLRSVFISLRQQGP